MPSRLTLTCIAVALILSSASAEALRCGNRIIADGLHLSEVLRLCGDPVAENERIIVVTEHLTAGHRHRRYRRQSDGRYVQRSYGAYSREVVITELTYNFGPNKLMRLLTFRDGWLDDVTTLGYGYHD